MACCGRCSGLLRGWRSYLILSVLKVISIKSKLFTYIFLLFQLNSYAASHRWPLVWQRKIYLIKVIALFFLFISPENYFAKVPKDCSCGKKWNCEVQLSYTKNHLMMTETTKFLLSLRLVSCRIDINSCHLRSSPNDVLVAKMDFVFRHFFFLGGCRRRDKVTETSEKGAQC